jgi:hypothetical protein
MVKGSYIKLYRSEATKELMKDKSAYMLLTQIAVRARRTDSFNVTDLKPGEALIGDFKSIGLTRQNYRTALKNLEKWKFITIKTTNKGTIATLCNNDVYDINISEGNQQVNQRLTNDQPAGNQQLTTNKNDKNEKNDNNVNNKKHYEKFKNHIKSNKERFRFEEKPDYSKGL